MAEYTADGAGISPAPRHKGWAMVVARAASSSVGVPVWVMTAALAASIALGGWVVSTLLTIQTQQAVILSELVQYRAWRTDVTARLRALELEQARQSTLLAQGR